MRTPLFLTAALLAGCATTQTHAPTSPPPAESGVGAAAAPLPFIDDDYAGALAQAKARGLPLFVDVWAPW